jgi:hypothetical protein
VDKESKELLESIAKGLWDSEGDIFYSKNNITDAVWGIVSQLDQIRVQLTIIAARMDQKETTK